MGKPRVLNLFPNSGVLPILTVEGYFAAAAALCSSRNPADMGIKTPVAKR